VDSKDEARRPPALVLTLRSHRRFDSLFSRVKTGHDGSMRSTRSDTNKAIDRALRKQLISDFTRPKALMLWAGIAAVIGLIVWASLGWRALGPMQYDGLVTGYVRGGFQPATKSRPSQPLKISVELDTGRTVVVNLPKHLEFRPDAPVRLKAFHKGEGEEMRAFYSFDSYAADDAPAAGM
jgi:hypothetical protein